MRCVWEISIRSPLRQTYQRPLRTSQKRWPFCDAFKTSHIHLKKDVFFVTSLRRLEHISKKMSIPWRLWDVSKTSLTSIYDFSKIPHKNGLPDFRRVIKISEKIDVGSYKHSINKRNVFWEQCIDINYQSYLSWVSLGWYLRENFGKSTIVRCIVGVLFTTYSDFFRLMNITHWNTKILVKLDKK